MFQKYTKLIFIHYIFGTAQMIFVDLPDGFPRSAFCPKFNK